MDYAIDWRLRVLGVREARRRFPLELSDTLWFLFGLGATLSFARVLAVQVPTGDL